MSSDFWSPGRYLQFEDERTRPARDLLARVPVVEPGRIVDMGCGPGNSTELLAERWPAAELTGLDSSPAMLEAARQRLPSVEFALGDAATWVPDTGTDVVFANAVYQWIPQHLQVFPRILDHLDSGACLAVQMPDNIAEPSHVLMREVGARMSFSAKLANAARAPLPSPRAYYDALAPHAARVDIWRTVYLHVLADAGAIVEWVKGTGLNPFLERLDADERTAYLAAYAAAIADAYPPAGNGRVLLAFPRLFIVAVR